MVAELEKIVRLADAFAQNKLDTRQYGNMTALESDLKRMVQNAKEFNATGSKVYEDAERIRKALSNFMPKHNPAYKDEDYRAQPTPVPGDNGDESDGDQVPTMPEGAPTPATIRLRVNGSTSRQTGSGLKDETPTMGSGDMQREQLKIVQEMIELRDPKFVAGYLCVFGACNNLPGAVMRIPR